MMGIHEVHDTPHEIWTEHQKYHTDIDPVPTTTKIFTLSFSQELNQEI